MDLTLWYFSKNEYLSRKNAKQSQYYSPLPVRVKHNKCIDTQLLINWQKTKRMPVSIDWNSSRPLDCCCAVRTSSGTARSRVREIGPPPQFFLSSSTLIIFCKLAMVQLPFDALYIWITIVHLQYCALWYFLYKIFRQNKLFQWLLYALVCGMGRVYIFFNGLSMVYTCYYKITVTHDSDVGLEHGHSNSVTYVVTSMEPICFLPIESNLWWI